MILHSYNTLSPVLRDGVSSRTLNQPSPLPKVDLNRYDAAKRFDCFVNVGVFSVANVNPSDLTLEEVAFGNRVWRTKDVDPEISGQYLGKMIRPQAEFLAFNKTLIQLLETGINNPKVTINSTLVANFIGGRWQVKADSIIDYAEIARDLMDRFPCVSVEYKSCNEHCGLWDCINYARLLIKEQRKARVSSKASQFFS